MQDYLCTMKYEMLFHILRRFIPLHQKICQKNPTNHMQSIGAAGIDSFCKGKNELPIENQIMITSTLN